LRASDTAVTTDYLMVRSQTLKSDNVYSTGALQSETYYETRLGKGDEIADRSFNYDAKGLVIKSKECIRVRHPEPRQ